MGFERSQLHPISCSFLLHVVVENVISQLSVLVSMPAFAGA